MADLNSVAPMLKEVWQRGHETAFSKEIVALSRIEATSDGMKEDHTGRYVVIPLTVRRPQGIGSRPERGILPLPGKTGYVGTRLEILTQYGVGEITAQTLQLVDGEPGAAIDALDEELTNLRESFTKDYARQVYGDGSGALATVISVAGNVVTVDSVQYLDEDMRLDAANSGLSAVVAPNVLVTAINDEDREVTLDDATGVVAGQKFVRNGNLNQEITGFGRLVSSTLPVQNLSPTDERRWAAIEAAGSGPRAYSEIEVTAQFQRVRRQAGAEKEPTVIFTEDGIERAIFAQLSTSREFHNTVEFAHGYSALPFNRGSKVVPMVTDPDYPADPNAATGELLGIHEPSVKCHKHEKGLHFAEETGSMFIASADRSDTWEFRIRQHSQLGIKQRNNHFRITDINRVAES
jgi:hypothetical protein